MLFFSCEEGSSDLSQEEESTIVNGEADTIIEPNIEAISEHDPEDVIGNIKQKYATTTGQLANGDYISVVKSYDCPEYPEEGTITFFSDSTGVRIIEHQVIQGSHGSENTKYYLNNGGLFFVYQVHSYWTFAESSDPDVPTTEDHVSEYRYYVHEGEVIKCLEKNYVVKENEDFDEMSKATSNVEFDCSGSIDILEKFTTLKAQINAAEYSNCIW